MRVVSEVTFEQVSEVILLHFTLALSFMIQLQPYTFF